MLDCQASVGATAGDTTRDGFPGPRSARRPRADGERSRRAILQAAAQLATLEGLDGLSIGRLAQHVGMSKSGLFAHFGSKEELQLATVETASEVYAEEVVRPALEAPEGLARLDALCEAFLSHVERRVFPGGCFFASAAAELDTRPGRVKERLAQAYRDWLGLLAATIRAAEDRGELARGVEADQLAFELNGLLLGANALFLLQDDPAALERARRGSRERLERAALP